MDELNIPIFKKSYDFYREFSALRIKIPKKDRYTTWQYCENYLLETIECIYSASQTQRTNKLQILERASLKLNMARVFVRLMKDTGTIDAKRYLSFQTNLDEIGRMLGGWIKSTR